MLPRVVIVAALAALAVRAEANAGGEDLRRRIALIPFVNLGAVDARALMMATMPLTLARKGYDVVWGEAVEGVLEAERVRYVDSIPAAALKRLLEETGTSAVLIGDYVVAEDAKQPSFGAVARLVGAGGEVLWSGTAALMPADTEGLFGLGRKKSLDALVRLAASDLLDSFPNAGEKLPVRTMLAGDRARPRASTKGGRLQAGRIYLLPLDNHTEVRNAPRLFEMLLAARLGAHSGLQVIEPAEMRAALAAEEIHSFSTFTPGQDARLRARLRASYFLRGSIFTMGAERDALGRPVPEVSLSLQLIEARTGMVAWSSNHARSGASYEKLLGVGTEHTLFGVVDAVVSEMIGTIPRAN